jgi:hypothetical protein
MSRIRLRKHYEQINLLPPVAPGKALTGINFIPRMNAKSNVNAARASQVVSKADPPTPAQFNWNSGDNVSQLSPVMDQAQCGGCWAFAIASALSDRYNVATPVGINPRLNPMHLMYLLLSKGETDAGSGCNGGNVAAASVSIEKCGIIEEGTEFFSPEQFKQANLSVTDTGILNQNIEAAATPYIQYLPALDACVQLGDSAGSTQAITLRYLIEPGTTKQIFYDLQDPESHADEILQTIKTDIFLRGPVVTAFFVYSDFFDPSKWTGGVYIHQWSNPDPSVQAEGEHAVVIVGWDSKSLVNPLTGATEKVPYWIVRNSWGVQWGDQGYFNFAMHPYNTHCGMDVPIQTLETDGVTKYLAGGCTTFQPAKSTLALLVPPGTPATPVAPTPGTPVVAPTPTPVVPVNPTPVNPIPIAPTPVVPTKPSSASSLAATRVVEAALITSVVILGICLAAWLIRRSRIRMCMAAPPSLPSLPSL